MKKVFFLLVTSIGFAINGFSMNDAKQTENYNTHKVQLKKNENKAKTGSINQTPNSAFIKQNKVKPNWDCWHFAIACIDGWFCANDIGTAFDHAAAIANQYCPCEN